MDHGIWADTGAWRECIEATLKYRMYESNLRLKRRQSRANSVSKRDQLPEKEGKGMLFSQKHKVVGAGATAFKKGFGKIKGLMQSKEQKFNEEVAKHSNMIFNELSKFVQHFCNMALPFSQANELLIYFCNMFQMEKSKMHILLTEL